ncbi:MAG: nickel insertion protein [Gemmataceae bacterium]
MIENKIFSETGTFGIRKQTLQRVKLERESIKVTTKFGEIAAKKGWDYSGHGIITPEYEDCARVARLNKIPLREVYSEVNLQIEKSKPSQE